MAVAATSAKLSLRDFSGGLNLQAAPSELAPNETPDCLNVTLDERGGVVKRLGLNKPGEVAAETGTPNHLYYSRVLDRLLMQVGTKLYPSSNGGVTWAASIKTFSSGARVGFCDFLGKLVVIHPVDGAFTWDGASFSAKVTNSPNGNVIAVWQNCLLSAGDPAQPTRLTRSDIGAITWPASPVTNDFRIKDDTPITALAAGSGLDTLAKGSLVVFKEESCYRVNDVSSSIIYATLSPTYGASGPLCVAFNSGVLAALSRRGIIVTDGSERPKLVSSRLEPLFRSTQESFQTSADWCAGVHRDRIVFSLRRASGTGANDTTLELHPQLGWIVRHGFGMQAFTNYVSNDRRLLGARVAATANAGAFEVFKGGDDEGSAISSYFQTPWLEPAGSIECRLLHLRSEGRGAFQIETRHNYAQAGVIRNFTAPGAATLWGHFYWGEAKWGASQVESFNDFYSLGIARSLSFVLKETSLLSATGPKLLSDGIAPELGAFACYGLNLDFVPLGVT